jgi:glycosyltransferase involved in cell wall biosynthesis
MRRKLSWVFPHLELEGGGTNFLLKTSEELNKKYEVSIICNTAQKKIKKRFEEKGIKIKEISFISANSNIYWAFLPFFLIIDFFNILPHLRKADYIFATMYPSNFLAGLFSFLFKKKYFYYCYEPFPYLQNKKFIKTFSPPKRILVSLISTLFRWTDLFAVKKAFKIFTLNQITQRMIKKCYKKNSIVTLMGVDSVHFKHYSRNKIADKFNGKAVVVHSTDYTEMKRTDLAIKAIKNVAIKYPEIILLITSTQPKSPNRSKYVKLTEKLNVKKNIIFLDFVSYSDLPLYYSLALCYLSCSFDEMLGTTTSNLPVKEALACGTPAIRSNTTKEDVEDGISGFLVNPKNTSYVANKIIYFIKNKPKARSMGFSGRKKIVSLYNWDNVVQVMTSNLY